MKQSLSSLNFILKADIKQFQTALREADKDLQKTGMAMKTAGGVLSTGITAPVVAATAAMFMLSTRSAEFADSIDEMSQRTGVAKSTLQELNFVASQVGIDFPTISRALSKVTKGMGEAASGSKTQAEIFDKLGISIRDSGGNLRSVSSVFPEIIGALSSMGNETERNYLTMELFGKGAMETITPLTALGQEGMQKMIDRAHELGVVMSDEGITSLAEYNDAMDSMKEQVKAAGAELSVGFAKIMTDTVLPLLQDKIIPAITALAKWFQELPSGLRTTIVAITGLVAVLGPTLLIFGKLITTIPTIIAAAKSMSAAMTVLNAVMAANPIGMVIVAIGALVAIFIWAWNKFEGFRMFLYGLWESFKAVFANIGTLAKNVLGGIGEMLVGVFTFDMQKITEGLDKLKSGFSEYGKKIADAYRSGAEAGKDLAETTAEVNEETKKLTTTDKEAVTPMLTLEQQISALEEKLWKEVQAHDANASSTARELRQKKELLQVYKDQMEQMLKDPTRMKSITSDQVQVKGGVTGPQNGDVLFQRETKQLSTFNSALKETETVSLDVSQAVRSALSDLAVLAGESLGNLIAGTFDLKDVFAGFIGIVGNFCKQLGEMMIGIGMANLILMTIGNINPYVAIAAGIALVALSAVASAFMSRGPFGSGGGSSGPSGPSNSGSYNMPKMASGGIVSRPTILMAGEGSQSEAILPINSLMNNIHNAIAMRDMGSSMGMGAPITVNVQVEGKLKAGDMYLMNKNYQTKLSQAK